MCPDRSCRILSELLKRYHISKTALSSSVDICRSGISAVRTIASFVFQKSHLALGVPDGLEETIALGKAVEGVVRLAHGANEAGESVDDVLALDGTAVLVDLGDGDLARTVVLGLDDAARRRALAGDVTVVVDYISNCLNHKINMTTYRSTISPRSFSILAVFGGAETAVGGV